MACASEPEFAPPSTDPFGLATVFSRATPTLADTDADGDPDAWIGNSGGITVRSKHNVVSFFRSL